MTRDRRLDFTQLYAMPANFDLSIDTADEIDIAVRIQPGEITSPVQPAAEFFGERIRDECLRGFVGPFEVASTDTHSTGEQFAKGANRRDTQ